MQLIRRTLGSSTLLMGLIGAMSEASAARIALGLSLVGIGLGGTALYLAVVLMRDEGRKGAEQADVLTDLGERAAGVEARRARPD